MVLREAMAMDNLDQAGIYAGTNTGQLFYSRDAGDHWELLADYLPPITSVETAVINPSPLPGGKEGICEI